MKSLKVNRRQSEYPWVHQMLKIRKVTILKHRKIGLNQNLKYLLFKDTLRN